MELYVVFSICLSLFLLGLSLGAIIENKRLKNNYEMMKRIQETQEIMIPLVSSMKEDYEKTKNTGTLVDYELRDPDETMEIPVFEQLQEEKCLRRSPRS